MEQIVKPLRKERGWSQEQLAEIADLSVRTVQRIEKGAPCSLETAKALATAFETTPDYFLKEDDTQNNEEQIQRITEIEQRRTFKRKAKFVRHFVIYLVVITALAATNLTSSSETIWFHYPMLGWGIGLIFHFLSAFNLNWEEKILKR